MKIEIFLQARMGSTRLPGKVLKTILGQPLLYHLIRRLKRSSEADGFCILTTTNPIDDAIVSWCQKENIPYFRGSEEDVLKRYYDAAIIRNVDAIVRVTGDCPLIDPRIIDNVISFYRRESLHCDYVSTALQRTFPKGMDIEIFSKASLEKAYKQATNTAEREHVTPYFYRHPEHFRLCNIASEQNLSKYRLTVDTPEDFTLIKLILEHLPEDRFDLSDIIQLLERHPQWEEINAHIIQKPLDS